MMKIDKKKLLAGERRELSRALTLVESSREDHQLEAQKLLDDLKSYSNHSFKIAISGPPGAGKSTFIDSLGHYLLARGLKLGVIAIDPSSPLSGGSILGDKTRMERIILHPNAFVRPSPTQGMLGGIAKSTRDMILLFEAAGLDIILIETVGVGQSEYEAASMVDFFMALMLPNSGDELQGIKKGILELVDGIVVNKADGAHKNSAKRAQAELISALGIVSSKSSHWSPFVLTGSALYDENIDSIWKKILEFETQMKKSGEFFERRKNQEFEWIKKRIFQSVNSKLKSFLEEHFSHKREGSLTHLEIEKIVDQFMGKKMSL